MHNLQEEKFVLRVFFESDLDSIIDTFGSYTFSDARLFCFCHTQYLSSIVLIAVQNRQKLIQKYKRNTALTTGCILLRKFCGRLYDSEEEGFEPPVLLLVRLFSKQMHSAALPLFLRKTKILPDHPQLYKTYLSMK